MLSNVDVGTTAIFVILVVYDGHIYARSLKKIKNESSGDRDYLMVERLQALLQHGSHPNQHPKLI